MKKSSAPLVEPDPTDQRFEYATFLWQGKPEHKNVLVMWMPFAVARPSDYLMINPAYDPKSNPYPSIYFFDGEDSDGLVFATSTFENLIAEGKIPPIVAAVHRGRARD